MINRGKLTIDLMWNYSSLVVLAASGILINVVIAASYGSSALGVFNQVYAVYIMASQFAVGGLHFSSLKYTAEHEGQLELQGRIFYSALFMAFIAGMGVSLLTYWSSDLIAGALNSAEVGKGLLLAAPALAFFSINKVLLATLNGLRWMRAFAIGQALRYLLMIGYVIWAAISEAPVYLLAGSFLFSELLLSILLLIMISPRFLPQHFTIDWEWVVRHAMFGFKAFFSGVFVEVNSRVDIFMLGFFMNDRVVGLYSFAAMLAEGFYHLLVVVRNILNPMLVQLIAGRKLEELRFLVGKTQRIVYPGMLLVALVIIGLFLPAIELFPNGDEFRDSFPVLIILTTGFWLIAGFIPFDTILTQAGYPGRQSGMNAFGMSSNLILNAILIPEFGAIGAAIATAGSFILATIYLNVLVHRRLGFTLCCLLSKKRLS